MKIILFLLTICIVAGWLVFAKVKTPPGVTAVWQESTPISVDLPTPAGFSVTPAQAYSIVKDAKALSLKHIWHIYADAQFYYVIDTFLSDSPQTVFVNGVRVHGQMGEIVAR